MPVATRPEIKADSIMYPESRVSSPITARRPCPLADAFETRGDAQPHHRFGKDRKAVGAPTHAVGSKQLGHEAVLDYRS